MIVLRLTIGTTSHDIRSEARSLVVGSDPTADVTLAHPDLAPRALRIVREDSEVAVELIGTDRRAVLRVGDEIELAGVGVALVGLLPAGTGPATTTAGVMFGGYDEDLPPRADEPAQARRFELSDTTTSGEPAAAAPPPLPNTQPPAGATPASARTQPDARPRDARPKQATAKQAATATGAAAATQKKRKPTPEEAAAALQPVEFPEPHFGTELLRQVRASPFYAVSIAFHLLLFFIISLFDTTNQERPPIGPGAIRASMDAAVEELAEEAPELEDEGLPQMPSELPDLPEFEDVMELEQPPIPPTPPKQAPLRVDEEVLQDPEPVHIGTMPSMAAANRQVRPRKPQMPKVDARKTFTKGAAGHSNAEAAKIVRAQLGRGRFGRRASLDDLEADDILVVGGSFDKIERVLDALRLKYIKKAPWALSSPETVDFSGYKFIFWNCGESLGRARMAAIGKRLKAFVHDGGYLFTTDWGVENVLPYAFPGYIRTNGRKAHLPEMVLHIEPAAAAKNHPLLEGVFTPGVKGKWWLEQASFDMSVGRKDAVTILIDCPALEDQFNRSPAVAATFHYGRGRVLHAMGHYFQEAGNIAGTISSHRLALNFVLMRLEQDATARER